MEYLYFSVPVLAALFVLLRRYALLRNGIGTFAIVIAFYLLGGPHFELSQIAMLPIYVGLGGILFALSFFLTTTESWLLLNKAKENIFRLKARFLYRVSAVHLPTALFEELLWRYALQSTLCKAGLPGIISVLLVAIFFWFDHKRQFATNAHRIEFILFSLFLGVTYFVTDNLVLVVTVHFARNFLVCLYIKCMDLVDVERS